MRITSEATFPSTVDAAAVVARELGELTAVPAEEERPSRHRDLAAPGSGRGAGRIRPRYRFRSAITGRFVSLLYALRHPRETIRERANVAHKPSRGT